MPKRSSKPPKDVNQLARSILDQVTGGVESVPADAPEPNQDAPPEKNPAAVALGRLGGLKGGAARAKALSKKKRAEIARLAASARWKKS